LTLLVSILIDDTKHANEVIAMPKKPKNNMSGLGDFLGALNEANGKVEEGIYSYKHVSEVPEEIQKLVFIKEIQRTSADMKQILAPAP
jgi:hypothetical protein